MEERRKNPSGQTWKLSRDNAMAGTLLQAASRAAPTVPE